MASCVFTALLQCSNTDLLSVTGCLKLYCPIGIDKLVWVLNNRALFMCRSAGAGVSAGGRHVGVHASLQRREAAGRSGSSPTDGLLLHHRTLSVCLPGHPTAGTVHRLAAGRHRQQPLQPRPHLLALHHSGTLQLLQEVCLYIRCQSVHHSTNSVDWNLLFSGDTGGFCSDLHRHLGDLGGWLQHHCGKIHQLWAVSGRRNVFNGSLE